MGKWSATDCSNLVDPARPFFPSQNITSWAPTLSQVALKTNRHKEGNLEVTLGVYLPLKYYANNSASPMVRLLLGLTGKAQSKHAKVTDLCHVVGNAMIVYVVSSMKCRSLTFVLISDTLPAIKTKLKLLTNWMNGKKPTFGLIDTPRMPFGSTWNGVVQVKFPWFQRVIIGCSL